MGEGVKVEASRRTVEKVEPEGMTMSSGDRRL